MKKRVYLVLNLNNSRVIAKSSKISSARRMGKRHGGSWGVFRFIEEWEDEERVL